MDDNSFLHQATRQSARSEEPPAAHAAHAAQLQRKLSAILFSSAAAQLQRNSLLPHLAKKKQRLTAQDAELEDRLRFLLSFHFA